MKLYSADYIDGLLTNFYTLINSNVDNKIYDEINKTKILIDNNINNAVSSANTYTDNSISEATKKLNNNILDVQNKANDNLSVLRNELNDNINQINESFSTVNNRLNTMDNKFLPLTGGTITGNLKLQQALQMSHGSVIGLTDEKNGEARLGVSRENNDVFLANYQNKWLSLKSDGGITYGGHQVYTSEFKPTPQDIGAAIGTNGIANNSRQFDGYSLWVGTQEAYDSLATKKANTIYMIID